MINRYFLTRCTAVVALWLLGDTSPVSAQMDMGTLRVSWPTVAAADTTTEGLAEARLRDVAITRLRAVDSALRPILPSETRFDVSVETCGRPDYMYDRNRRRVVLCTEMDRFARALIRASLGPASVIRMGQGGGDHEAEDALDGFAIFAILHEVGHAAIDQLRLPVAGSSEDAADGFAAYTLLARGESGIVQGAAQWLAWLEPRLSATSVALSHDFADGHSLPGQRYERLRCLVEGRERVTPDSHESTNRPDCGREWRRLSEAWQRLLPAKDSH
jgi:hypothetical protein